MEIKTFKDFLNESSVSSATEKGASEYKDVPMNDEHDELMNVQTRLNDLHDNIPEPDFEPVYKNAYMQKLVGVLIKYINAALKKDFVQWYNFIFLNGEKAALIYSPSGNGAFTIVHRTGNGNEVSYFDKFDLDGKNQVARYVISSKKYGLSDMIKDIIFFLKNKDNGDVNEARTSSTGLPGESQYQQVIKSPKKMSFVKDKLTKDAASEIIRLARAGVTISAIATEIMNTCGTNPNFKCFEPYEDNIGFIGHIVGFVLHEQSDILDKLEENVDVEIDTEGTSTDWGKEFDDYMKLEEKEMTELERLIKKRTKDMCRYVKSHGRDVPPGFTSRGMYIIGRAGTGKSHAIEETLKEQGMEKDIDYFDWSNGTTKAINLYDNFYKFNGKLLLMDDAAAVVNGEARIAMWKKALGSDGWITCPLGSSTDDSEKYYNVEKRMTRRERYFREIGNPSKIKTAKELKKLRATITSKDPEDRERELNKKLAMMDDNAQPMIPNKFKFDGCVIIVANMNDAELKKNVTRGGAGEEDFTAIADRFGGIITYAPSSYYLWIKIKEKIVKEMEDSSIPDDACMIPRKYAQDFIDEVESLFNKQEGGDYKYDVMTWRIAQKCGGFLRDPEYIEGDLWKRQLDQAMMNNKYKSQFNRNSRVPLRGMHF